MIIIINIKEIKFNIIQWSCIWRTLSSTQIWMCDTHFHIPSILSNNESERKRISIGSYIGLTMYNIIRTF